MNASHLCITFVCKRFGSGKQLCNLLQWLICKEINLGDLQGKDELKLTVHFCGELACALIPLASLPSSFTKTLFCCLWSILHTSVISSNTQHRRTPCLSSSELQGILTPSWVIQFYYWKLLFLLSNRDISLSSHVPLCSEVKLNSFDY